MELITIRSGLEEGLLYNLSTNTYTMILPQQSSFCANDHRHRVQHLCPHCILASWRAGGRSPVYHVLAAVHGGRIFN